MQEKLMEFGEMLDMELGKEMDKIISEGTISPDNIKVLKDAMKLKKLIKECEDEGYSSRRGRSRRTGRYMSRDGGNSSFGSYDSYGDSYDNSSYRGSYRQSGHTQIVSELERLYEKAQSEKERRMIDEWIQRAESAQ